MAILLRLLIGISLLSCTGKMSPSGSSTDDSITPELGITYYVRTDGGDAIQCNGKADVAYPGTGTDEDCAWSSPLIPLPSTGSALIDAGDRLLIGSGSYTIPKASGDSVINSIPSGLSASHRTRILGQSCSSVPKLIGTGGVVNLFDLSGISHVEIGCLEITDDHDCIRQYDVPSGECGGSDGARNGIYANTSQDVWLRDLDIHGFSRSGMNTGNITDWTVDRVKLRMNGHAGWQYISGAPNSGTMIVRDVEVTLSGCGETVATGQPWGCWGGAGNGYGDGMAMGPGGQWLFEDVHVHHNTSDGIDFYHMDGAASSQVVIRRARVENNAGNQIKIAGNSLIENSVIIAHCMYFDGKYASMGASDHCRAFGAAVSLIFEGDNTATVRHNTIAGEGDTLITHVTGSGGNTNDKLYILNNLGVGFPYFVNDGSSTAFRGGVFTGERTMLGNLVWDTETCPSSGAICVDPNLTNMTLSTFNAVPLAGSPAIDAADASDLTADFLGNPRPVGPAPDIGAYEVQ